MARKWGNVRMWPIFREYACGLISLERKKFHDGLSEEDGVQTQSAHMAVWVPIINRLKVLSIERGANYAH